MWLCSALRCGLDLKEVKVHGKDLAISKRVALVRRQTLALSLFMSLSLSLSDSVCMDMYPYLWLGVSIP